jgi:hypothetical protein
MRASIVPSATERSMKILILPFLLVLSGCMSVDRLAGYELAPARNPPSMTVQPATLQPAYRASNCGGSEVNGVCYESFSSEGKIAANAPSAAGE